MSTESIGRGARVLSGVLVLVSAIGLLVLLPILPFVVAAADTVDATREQLIDRPPLPEQLPVAAQISTVHDAAGEKIAELSGVERRQPVTLDQVPQVLVDAVLAIEDDEFYEHNGVNHQSVLRATARNLTAGEIEEGASTITQQYVKMTLLDPEQTLDRKMHEVVWAVELEKRLSKDEILERYLNAVYLGEGVYGVGTAARHYFNKPVGELTLAEAALLAATIQSPSAVNPVVAPNTVDGRRDVVLELMLRHGMVDREAAEAAMEAPIELDIRDEPQAEPFWIDYVKRLVYDETMTLQPGLREAVAPTRDERIDALFEGGLRIHTTLDSGIHDRANATLDSHLTDPAADPLGALITVEHATGALRAVAVGPRQFGACPPEHDDCNATQVNPALPDAGGSGRQAGSAFKPFVAATALAGGVDWTHEYDTPSGEEVEGCGYGEPYAPENYGGTDGGEVNMVEAIRRSNNVYFVKLARDVGVERIVEHAQAHGVTESPNLADFSDLDCSLALGTPEIFPLEMAVGYGTWANNGVRCSPYLIERIEDRFGEVIYQHEPQCEQVISESLAGQMRSMLAQPVGEGGTAAGVGARIPNAFGKTGTTQDYADAWFVGFAGDHSTAAWVGHEQPTPLRDVTIGGQYYPAVTGGSLPATMWAEYMAGLAG